MYSMSFKKKPDVGGNTGFDRFSERWSGEEPTFQSKVSLERFFFNVKFLFVFFKIFFRDATSLPSSVIHGMRAVSDLDYALPQ
jgi:hypothetical protein